MSTDLKEILKEYWGFDEYRPVQEDIINSVLEGHDTLALLPTGGGKSICFQVPAMAKPGICLVISPLIALIRDQVSNLRKKGIPALAIYSGMPYLEIRKSLQNAAHGNFKFLYISPERLETDLFKEFLPSLKVNLLAVDEAHCISQWGYDFRPAYLRIAEIREQLPTVPVLALTASATAGVLNDISEKLLFPKDHKRFMRSFERQNLSYSVFNSSSKQNKLVDILSKVSGTAIVYCKTRKRTVEVARLLNMKGLNADHYHAGLSNEERTLKQERWINNETRIMACTNAFGMGIDKPDVRIVVHYDVPDCLENYYQEAGRAGRDGKKSYAVLLYSEQELNELEEQTALKFPGLNELKEVYKAVVNYLQLPTGLGEDRSFDLDMLDLCKKFKLDSFKTSYAFKALAQEGLFTYNEQFFTPSTIIFTCNRQDLETFQQAYPESAEIIKGLLRSYEGIFDYPAIVDEKRFSSFMKIETGKLRESLLKLNNAGIIEYTMQKDKPQIYFHHDRVAVADFRPDLSALNKRRKAYEERLQMILKYTRAELECRSTMIANYFNDKNIKPCGVCDNCLAQKNTKLSSEEFEKIKALIIDLSTEEPVKIHDLLKKTAPIARQKVWKVVNHLLSEEEAEVKNEGEISMTRGRGKKKGPR